MSWRVPPFDAAVDEIERHVRATYKTHGIFVSGSIVRGEAGPTSDFDVFIVHAEPWRLRDQKRFNGVPTELFVNPPDRIRGYFKNEHAEGRPCTAHMLTTGVLLAGADDVATALLHEAREWMARPLDVTPKLLENKRYAIVDSLDDARDALEADPPAAALLLGEVVRNIIAYAFWERRLLQPRRKSVTHALAAIDPVAADLVREFANVTGSRALQVAVTLAQHVLGVDTFFEWTSDRS